VVFQTTSTGPEREHPYCKAPFLHELLIELPLRFTDPRVFCPGHAFLVEVFNQLQKTLLLLGSCVRGDEPPHHVLGGLFHDTGGIALLVAVDRAGGGGVWVVCYIVSSCRVA